MTTLAKSNAAMQRICQVYGWGCVPLTPVSIDRDVYAGAINLGPKIVHLETTGLEVRTAPDAADFIKALMVRGELKRRQA